jgi:hypothetical protein
MSTSTKRFVAPAPTVERREPVPIDLSPLMGGEVIHVGEPLAARFGATEQTSGMDRSLAWAVRMGVFALIILILSITLANYAGGGWVLAFCLFSSLSLLLFVWMDGREHKYSRNGLELHKVDTLADLKELEMDYQQRRVMKVLDAQIEMAREERRYEWARLGVTEQAFAVRNRTIEGRIAASPKGYLEDREGSEASAD